MRSLAATILPSLMVLGLGCSPSTGPQGPPVDVQPLTFAGLEQKLTGWKGKVVVLDFWASY